MLNKQFKPAIVAALMASCSEYDFLQAAEYLLECARGGLVDLPPIRIVRDATGSLNAARIRIREALMHVSDFNGDMKEVSGMVEQARQPKIVTATPEQAAAVANAAQVAGKLILDE